MITLLNDPNSLTGRQILSATVTLYIDRLLTTCIQDELEKAIRAAAVEELTNRELRKELKKIGHAYVEKFIADKIAELQLAENKESAGNA